MRGQQLQPLQHTFLWKYESSDFQISMSGGQTSSKLTSFLSYIWCKFNTENTIVSSPTLFPVLLILTRWQQVTCSLIVSFLGIVGPKCCDSMKCHCFWEVMVFRYRPRGESQTSYVFLVVILYFNVKLYFKLQNTST